MGVSATADVEPRGFVPEDEKFRLMAGARAFVDAIVEGRPMTPGFGDGVKAQQVIDAALSSHREGGWVAMTE